MSLLKALKQNHPWETIAMNSSFQNIAGLEQRIKVDGWMDFVFQWIKHTIYLLI